MAAQKGSSSGRWMAAALGGIVAGLAMPKLLRSAKLFARTAGGMKFTSGSPRGERPHADPGEGRPA